MYKSDIYYIMTMVPSDNFAKKYCLSNGFDIGTICEIVDVLNDYTYRLRRKNGKYEMDVGSNFFNEHFDRYVREENLRILLD